MRSLACFFVLGLTREHEGVVAVHLRVLAKLYLLVLRLHRVSGLPGDLAEASAILLFALLSLRNGRSLVAPVEH